MIGKGCRDFAFGRLQMINVGLNIQKLAHNRHQELTIRAAADPSKDESDVPSPFKSPLWIQGLATQLTGESGNMVAYAFTAASVG